MRESAIERKLVHRITQVGGLALKFVPTNWAGAPDRLILLPDARILFVETKAPSKHMRPLQEKRANELRRLGFSVYCLDSMQAVEDFMTGVVGQREI